MDEADLANEYLARSMRAWEESRPPVEQIDPEDGPVRCIDCDCIIPQARRRAIPGCVRCVECQQEYDDG